MRSSHAVRGVFAGFVALSILLTGCGPAKPGRAIRPAHGAVLATVNEQPIDQASVDFMTRLLNLRGDAPSDSIPGATPEARMTHAAVERLIDREVVLQDAERRAVSVDTARVSEAYRQFESQAGRDSALTKGLSDAEIRQNLAEDLIVNSYFQKTVIDSLPVSEEEMTAYMQANPALFETPARVHARQILIPLDTETATPQLKAAARGQAEAILAEVRKPGADFAAIARARSKDTNSAGSGGDLGMLSRNQTVPAFDSVAFALEPGEISDVVVTPYGYHIIKIDEKFPATPRPMESVKEQLVNVLRQQKAQGAIKARVAELRAAARIVYRTTT